MAKKIILDCDPGIDDALAITFAVGSPDLDLIGITSVAGNVGLDLTTSNAQRVCEFIGAPGIPVTPGAAAPLLRAPIDARLVHGDSGLGGARLPDPRTPPAGGHAIDYIIDTIKAAPGEITLVATGPLTNIALAVHREPRLVSLVSDFVIMGGSASRGNVTPAAEFNIGADPEAAAVVFRAGWTVTMVGLDVTLQARATAAVKDRLRPLGPLASELVLPGLDQYATDADPLAANPLGPAVHDVVATAYTAAPGLLGCLPARVEVETTGRWTAGMTVTDFAGAEPNALVATAIDVRGFWDLVLDSYHRVAAAMSTPAQARGHRDL
ncbi:MAG TPA: nucleoside hydrolase [Streptosporangiaceae bacterium]|nr:nucleoside hydrolase [Streptosporangiaceae bacterium]